MKLWTSFCILARFNCYLKVDFLFLWKAGDQILDVNGQSFLNITHKKAVKVLKSTRNMIITLKDIGRLPFTRVTHDKTRWITQPTKNGQIQRYVSCTHHVHIMYTSWLTLDFFLLLIRSYLCLHDKCIKAINQSKTIT